jgi:hypothetical protein
MDSVFSSLKLLMIDYQKRRVLMAQMKMEPAHRPVPIVTPIE